MPKLNELNIGMGSFLLIMREALLGCFKLIM